jgi:hypothetical protein
MVLVISTQTIALEDAIEIPNVAGGWIAAIRVRACDPITCHSSNYFLTGVTMNLFATLQMGVHYHRGLRMGL